MRIAAMAAMLAVAHGTAMAARSDWNDNGGPGFGSGGALNQSDRQQIGPFAQAARALVADTQRRDADARCGCDSASGGQAARAGF